MQEQHEIKVHFLDGRSEVCSRTGNNAAWLCMCGRRVPLLGYSDELDSPKTYSGVVCPDCSQTYRVVAPGLKQVPTHVQELTLQR